MYRCLFAAVFVICVLTSSLYAQKKQGFEAFIVGNPADAQPAQTLSPGLVIMGGGTDVDAAFQWMCERAGGGDFVVIRTTGTDAYNPYIQELCPPEENKPRLSRPSWPRRLAVSGARFVHRRRCPVAAWPNRC